MSEFLFKNRVGPKNLSNSQKIESWKQPRYHQRIDYQFISKYHWNKEHENRSKRRNLEVINKILFRPQLILLSGKFG